MLIISVFIAFSAMAQQDSSFRQKKRKDSLRDNKFCIEIAPLALIDFIDVPSCEIGAEVKLINNVSAYFEGGGYYSAGGRMSDVNGYIIKGELKFYGNKNHISSGPYLSLEGFYKKQSFNWQDSIHLSPPSLTTFRDFKSVYCFNLKFGKLIVHKSKIILDWYVGLGVRYRNITSTLTPQQISGLKYDDDSPYDSDLTGTTVDPIGRTVGLNLELGFKIGYLLR